ncbi:MAG: thioesterase family protein [Oleispira sp.]|nr:thioesterase family protein [Oleispira sp.]
MSGLIRNIITFICALLSRSQFNAQSTVTCYFLITPFDCGVSVLKSDKYFQLAESAQLDFLVKTKLLGKLRDEGLSFVNASQLVKFMKPVGVFSRVRVETRIIFTDDKCAYFSHSIFIGKNKHCEVLVKMKFKKGALTVAPAKVLGEFELENLPYLQSWSQTLESMS